MPSFRDSGNIDCYDLEYEKVLKAMEDRFGGDWICLARLHPRTKKYDKELIVESDKLIDACFYPDIQELLVSSDVAITDYSSCIFDFMLSRKPAFVFATDIKDFNNDRGFYYPLEATPFPIAVNNKELVENVLKFDDEKYQKDITNFLEDKGCMEDGHASERVVDLIEQIMKEEV